MHDLHSPMEWFDKFWIRGSVLCAVLYQLMQIKNSVWSTSLQRMAMVMVAPTHIGRIIRRIEIT